MSDLLRQQIDDAMQDVQVRERYSRVMLHNPDEKEQYESETRLMRIDCLKGLQWLENCRK
jgi:hypothetical protein